MQKPGAQSVSVSQGVAPQATGDGHGHGPVRSIEIAYGSVASYIYGAGWWILYFFVVSMAVALIFNPVFNVKF